MENRYYIFPVGSLQNVEVDLVGVKTLVDFEFIEIMGENDPYLALLVIDLDYENYDITDLKKETMTFELDGMRVTQPLDLLPPNPGVTKEIMSRGPRVIYMEYHESDG
jgi:hypothetical protein